MVEKIVKAQLNVWQVLGHYALNLFNHLGDKMKYENNVVSKVPRPSRVFQMGMLHHIESRFQELAQISCSNARHVKQQICKSKALLLDIRHIILYQSFDYDMREKIMMRADAIVNYINSFMNTINHEGSTAATRQIRACA